MKLLSSFLCSILVLVTMPGAMAAAPSTNTAPAVPVPAVAKGKKTATQAKSTPVDMNAKPVMETNAAPISQPAPVKFEDYLKELSDTLKLTDEEKKDIESYYLMDGMLLKNILNNDALSPLQQAQQVSDLRDARNAKIKTLLQDTGKQDAFLKIEARYRVALTELAADGGLVPAPVPSPAPAAPAPAPAEKTPNVKAAAK